MNLPADWKTVKLSELLNPEQIINTERIINSAPGPLERTKRLKIYFNEFREQLEAKGVLPEYLAYAVDHLSSLEIKRNARNN